MADGFKVEGLANLQRKLKEFPPEVRVAMTSELKDVGDLVRADAQQRFDAYDLKSAAGYRVYRRGLRIIVQQSLRKTTGKHPEYGALQMRRALLPALADHKDEVEARASAVIDSIAGRF